MIEFYSIPLSLYCAKLRILLRHKQLTWREILPPGGYGSAEYKKIVASGNLPAIDDDGLLIADSEAIAEYLNEKFPSPAMLPERLDLRAKARERSRFHDTRLEPELRILFPQITSEARDRALIKNQCVKITARLNQFSQLLETSAELENGLSLGDCGFAISFVWLEELTPRLGLSIVWPQNVIFYKDRLNTNPAIKAELESYRPELTGYLNKQFEGGK